MLWNCHVHTENSHDSTAKVCEMCDAAIAARLTGIAVTDHCDCEYASFQPVAANIERSFLQAEAAKKRYAGRLCVISGIELGDPLFNETFARAVTGAHPYDAVLLSVHAVRFRGHTDPFSRIDFSDWDDGMIRAYLRQYFIDLKESMLSFDYDILCHLTVPIRYIRYKYGKSADVGEFEPQITDILRQLIRADKTLELNTQSAEAADGYYLPDARILQIYLREGGKKITLGSDAHRPEQIASGLRSGASMLRGLGVSTLMRFENRTAIPYPIGPTAL